MYRPEIEDHVKKLAAELQQLLEKNILKNPDLAEDKMYEASKIIKQVESYGFLVNLDICVDINDLELAKVTVVILKPKDDLSPEDQQAYDNWFLNKAKIKTEPAK